MREFRVERVAQNEFEDAADWYERQREGLGEEFRAAVDKTLARVENQDKFATLPIATLVPVTPRSSALLHRRGCVDRGAATAQAATDLPDLLRSIVGSTTRSS